MNDLPPVRPEPEIIEAFTELAERCSTGTNPDEIADRFIEAYRLQLEARVPRMPEDPDELRDMFAAAVKEPPSEALSLADVEQHMGERRFLFMEFQTRFYALLQLEAWESAAMMLLPVEGRTGPGYYGSSGGDYYRMEMTTHGYLDGVYQNGPGCTIYHPLSSGGEPRVDAFAPMPGLAMLAAILKAHSRWHELWKR